MPRYFFHVKDEQGWIKDEEGLELPDLAAAMKEADGTAVDLAKAAIRESRPVDGRTVVVFDDQGQPVYLLPVKQTIRQLGN